MKKLLVLLTFIAAFGALGRAHAQLIQTQKLDGIVAVVDDDVILQSELDRAVDAVQTQYAKNPQQLPSHDILERQVLDRLILQKLQLARADSTGVKVADADVDQALAQIAGQNHMGVSQLRSAIQQQGLSWDQFRKNVRDELVIQHLRQRVVQGRVQVSDSEVDLMLKNAALQRGQLHLGYILVSLPDGATPEQIDAAHKKADEVEKQIAGGMDFSAAAIRYSDAQNALQGGDLGWRGYDELPPALAEIGDKMQINQVSAPIRGPAGFHIIKLLGKRDNPKQIVTEYHPLHIMIKISEIVSSEQAEKKIADIRRRILAGADFARQAREFSQDTSTANLGGDMGWIQADAYGPQIATALKGLKDGQVSEPFQTEVGWHLLKLLGSRTQDMTNQVERDQARQILFNRKAEEEYEAFLRQIRSEAYVDVRLPGGDKPASGASGTP